MNTTQNTPVTHRLDYIHRFIPAHAGREDYAEDYTSYVPIEIQAKHIRQSLHLYAPGSCYILIRVEGTVDEPLFVQPLNMLSLDFPEPGPGLRTSLTESPIFLEPALAFWKDAKAI
jgi:hypothetical protein